VFALANEHELPVLIHAGRGISPLGPDLLRLTRAYPRATAILAHAAISDLAWITDLLDTSANILFDTAWWNPIDLLALFALVPAERILFGSDTPYGHPALNTVIALRCARAVGLDDGAIRSIMGEQLTRLLTHQRLATLGPAPGSARLQHDIQLDRVLTYVAAAWGATMVRGTPEEPLSLARGALAVSPRHPHHHTFAQIADALDLPPIGPYGLGGVALAATLAATSIAR
jgi:Tat protein secretion system quality control protein TatD with DNase activity